MKNLRNMLKKLTTVMLLAIILFNGTATTTPPVNPDDEIISLDPITTPDSDGDTDNPDNGIMLLGGPYQDVDEF